MSLQVQIKAFTARWRWYIRDHIFFSLKKGHAVFSHASEKVKTFRSPERRKVICFTNGLISEKDTLTEITPVTCLLHTVSPICCLPPPRLTNQLLSAPESCLSDKLRPRTCREAQTFQSCQSSWGERWTACRLVWGMQSKSPPCQHSAEVSPVTRKYRTRLTGIYACEDVCVSMCVYICGGLCASVNLIQASVST